MPNPADKSPADNASDSFPCKHPRKRLIAQDEDAEYWECLDCGEIFEPGESSGAPSVDGSLSDA
jgi:hypothetical protein